MTNLNQCFENMKKQDAKEKKFRELSEEELEKVNGGVHCYTDTRADCKLAGGTWTQATCTCSVDVR